MSYVPHTDSERQTMLRAIGADSLDALFRDIPGALRNPGLKLPDPLSELELLDHLTELAETNRPAPRGRSFLGGGAYHHHIPAAVDELAGRSEFYTAYTPYQAEISQGMLQAIFEYQTAIARLTGLDAANASLYDGGTAVYEACVMAVNHTRRGTVVYDASLNPQYRQVLAGYSRNGMVKVRELPYAAEPGGNLAGLSAALDGDTAAVIVQYPDFFGRVSDFTALAAACHAKKALLVMVANPLALGVLKTPGECGADIAVGDAQPLGMPLSYGGPYLGYIACQKDLLRKLPGRIVGETVDRDGKRGFVLTLQAREQHIKRERATSNICSNQALCALRALVYCTVMGKRGLQRAAELCARKAAYAREALGKVKGVEAVFTGPHFHEFVLRFTRPAAEFAEKFGADLEPGIQLGRWYPELADGLLVAVTEVNRKADIDAYAERLGEWLNA